MPGFELNGGIRIDFDSGTARRFDAPYDGWFWSDPGEFTPEWFHNATNHHVETGNWGDGIEMELNDGSSWNSPFYLCIKYLPFGSFNRPSEKDAEALFRRMLNVLAGFLENP